MIARSSRATESVMGMAANQIEEWICVYATDRTQSTSRRAIIKQTTCPMITSNAAGDANRFFEMYLTASLVRQMRPG